MQEDLWQRWGWRWWANSFCWSFSVQGPVAEALLLQLQVMWLCASPYRVQRMKFYSSDLPSTLAHNLQIPFPFVQQRVIKKDRTQQWHNQQFYYPAPGCRHSGTWSECLWEILVNSGLNARSLLCCTASPGMVFLFISFFGRQLVFFFVASSLRTDWSFLLGAESSWRQGFFRYQFGRYLVFSWNPLQRYCMLCFQHFHRHFLFSHF